MGRNKFIKKADINKKLMQNIHKNNNKKNFFMPIVTLIVDEAELLKHYAMNCDVLDDLMHFKNWQIL